MRGEDEVGCSMFDVRCSMLEIPERALT